MKSLTILSDSFENNFFAKANQISLTMTHIAFGMIESDMS